MKVLCILLLSILLGEALFYQIQSKEIDTFENKAKLFNSLFKPERDIIFLLFTRRNRFVGQRVVLGDTRSLFESNFNISRPSRFWIHGWGGDVDSLHNRDGADAFLEKDDLNLFVVDWSRGSQTFNYFMARNKVSIVGETLANFIDFMHANYALNFKELTLVGFSLGAHIAGIAGKNVKRGRINTIIGLDPAGPLFREKSAIRLDSGDAEYVECIHTNTRVSGISYTAGHADFYPNSGASQPGCWTSICSHNRAISYYFESLNSNNFWASKCDSLLDLAKGCSRIQSVTMGGEPSNAQRNVTGIFYLATNRFPPFAQGRLS